MEPATEKLLVEKSDRIKDLVVGTIIVGVGAYGGMSIYGTSATGFVHDQTMDHTTLPSIWGALVVLLGGLWIFQTATELYHINRSLKTLGSDGNVWSLGGLFPNLSPLLLFRMAAIVFGLVIYALTLETLPFYLITGVFLLYGLIIFGQPLGLRTMAIAAAGAAAFHGLFVLFLQLPL